MSKNVSEFISSCTNPNPIERSNAKDLLDHPFIKQKLQIKNISKMMKKFSLPQLKRFDLTSKILGKGGFGEVRLGFIKKTDMPAAIKIL